ncbi:MAG: type II secretion system protein [Fimbriimonadaceae bacterium]|nr:type II secretion system protein [Fimbriimonadaceae bacterium]
MSRRGVTLIEVLCVTVILSVLGGLLVPVYIESRRSAMITQSMGKMRQWHIAFTLYAESSEPNANGIGYPLSLSGLRRERNFPESMLLTSGVALPGLGRAVYTYMPATSNMGLDAWREHVRATQGNPIILVDDTHNPGNYKFEPFATKVALGLFHDGHIERKRRPGNFGSYSDWETP